MSAQDLLNLLVPPPPAEKPTFRRTHGYDTHTYRGIECELIRGIANPPRAYRRGVTEQEYAHIKVTAVRVYNVRDTEFMWDGMPYRYMRSASDIPVFLYAEVLLSEVIPQPHYIAQYT